MRGKTRPYPPRRSRCARHKRGINPPVLPQRTRRPPPPPAAYRHKESMTYLIAILLAAILVAILMPRTVVTTARVATHIEPPQEVVDEWADILAKVRDMHAV